MKNEEWTDLFFESIVNKISKFDFYGLFCLAKGRNADCKYVKRTFLGRGKLKEEQSTFSLLRCSYKFN